MDNPSSISPQVSIVNLKHQHHKDNNVFILLNQLTNSPKLSEEEFSSIITELPQNHRIFLLYENNVLAGMCTILIEQKLTYNGSKIAHIEDVVVDKKYRGKGYAKKLVNHCIDIAKLYNCYKIILNCSDEVKPLYEKCGFTHKTNGMSLYFTD